MKVITQTYISLLADVAHKTGFSEIRGSCSDLQWCVNDAPKLEKAWMRDLEIGRKPDVESMPPQLRRLALGSIEDPIKMRYLRQLLLFCYKVSMQHDKTTTDRSIENFINTNSEVGAFASSFSTRSPALLSSVKRQVQSVLFSLREADFIPSHGPGAVTTCKEKWEKSYSTINAVFNQADTFCMYFNQEHAAELPEDQTDLIEAKLIAVPKDSRGPRLICVHPAEAIWVQQGVRRMLEKCIQRVRRAKGPWPYGHIHFDDQSVNGRIALLSSKSRRYATLDMKEASDRISDVLVQILFGRYYSMFGACRAQTVRLPGDTRLSASLNLNCYAPMGNATTFPVQSLVFWAICVASLQRQGYSNSGAVFVFGDDLIVPSQCASGVCEDLESFGLCVNKEKSFWRGAFRESCGVDAYNGINVTPLRWKTSTDAEHLTDIQALSELAMRMRIAGYWEASVTIYSHIRRFLLVHYNRTLFLTNNPDHGGIAEYVESTSSVLHECFPLNFRLPQGNTIVDGWHSGLHWWYTVVWRLQETPQVRRSHGWNHVLESVCKLSQTARSSIPSRLVSRQVKLVRGWTRVR